MTIKTILAAPVLALAPGVAMAAGCSFDKPAKMTCAEGYLPDATGGVCMAKVNS